MEQIKHLRASLRKRQWRKPVVARPSDGRIIAGHGIVEAAKLEGWTTIPVWPWECTDTEARAYLVADNELNRGSLVDDDREMLARLLADIQRVEGNLDGIGWAPGELNDLLKEIDRSHKATLPGDDDDAPEPRHAGKSDSEVGQVYDLGPHRLACGSSGDPAVWAALLRDERADCVWTDPPYGVAYVGGSRMVGQQERKKQGGMTIENDDLDADKLTEFLLLTLGATCAVCKPGAPWYVASPSGIKMGCFVDALRRLEIWHQTLVWVKSSLVPGYTDYHYRHETIFYGWAPGEKHIWHSDRKQHSVLEFDRPTRNDLHPTMKPLALVQYCLRNSTVAGDVVADAFGGSGSTLIAAACEGRVARLVELDPHYCDVIRRRWTRWAKRNKIDPGPGALDG